MTVRRGALALGLVLVGLVALLAVPGNGILETRNHRAAGTVFSHLSMLLVLWSVFPALRGLVPRLDDVSTSRLAAVLAAAVLTPLVTLIVMRLAAPQAAYQLITREWGLVEPLQVALYAVALALWSLWPIPAVWALLLAYGLAVWIAGALRFGEALARMPGLARAGVLALLLLPGGAALWRAGPELASNERYDTVRKRAQHADEIVPKLHAALHARTALEWEAYLGDDVPCAAARAVEDVFDNAQVLAEDMVGTLDHALVGRYRGLTRAIKFDRTPGPPPFAAPTFGQHSETVLKQNGCSTEEIEELRRKGAVL